MHKCVRVSMYGVSGCDHKSLCRALEQAARERDIEGSLYVESKDYLHIVAAGSKDSVDCFLDVVHQWSSVAGEECKIQIEASSKDRDYRGTFRVVE